MERTARALSLVSVSPLQGSAIFIAMVPGASARLAPLAIEFSPASGLALFRADPKPVNTKAGAKVPMPTGLQFALGTNCVTMRGHPGGLEGS